MSAQAVIDPVEQTLRLGERVWRFDWDPSAATVAIELGDRTYELNGITWRQKRNLARALASVAVPLGRALLRASLGERATLPSEPMERDALVALSEWLSAMQSSLPLQPATLAQATLEICRAGALTPLDLDDLPAGEVEEMWQAVAAQGTRPESVPGGAERAPASRSAGGFKRIVVMPDPPKEQSDAAAADRPAEVDRANQAGSHGTAERSASARTSAETETEGSGAARDIEISSTDGVNPASARVANESTPAATPGDERDVPAKEPDRSPSSSHAVAQARSRRFRMRAVWMPVGPSGRLKPALTAEESTGRQHVLRSGGDGLAVAGVASARFTRVEYAEAAPAPAHAGRAAEQQEIEAPSAHRRFSRSERTARRDVGSDPDDGATQPIPPHRAGVRGGSPGIDTVHHQGLTPIGVEERLIAFLDDREPSESVRGNVDSNRREFEDALIRGAAEAGLDVEA